MASCGGTGYQSLNDYFERTNGRQTRANECDACVGTHLQCLRCMDGSAELVAAQITDVMGGLDTLCERITLLTDITLNYHNILTLKQALEIACVCTPEPAQPDLHNSERLKLYCALTCLVSENDIMQLATLVDTGDVPEEESKIGIQVGYLVNYVMNARKDVDAMRTETHQLNNVVQNAYEALNGLRQIRTGQDPASLIMRGVISGEDNATPQQLEQERQTLVAVSRRQEREQTASAGVGVLLGLLRNETAPRWVSGAIGDPATHLLQLRKTHLVEKLERNLDKDRASSGEENEPCCCVCLRNFPNVVLDCGDLGHQNTCVHCTYTMVTAEDESINKCPVCYTRITGVTILAATDATRMVIETDAPQ